MKKLSNIIRFLLLIFLSAPTLVAAQVSLKKFDDPDKQGYQSIVFEKVVGKNADGSDKKEAIEFNIQENGPFNSLEYPLSNNFKNQQYCYKLTSSQTSDLFGVDESQAPENGSLAIPLTWIQTANSGAFLSYNLIGYTELGQENGLRKSILQVLNNNGEIIYTKELNTDSHAILLSSNGKYLGYGYGEQTHDYEPEEVGYKFINIKTTMKLLTLKAGYWKLISLLMDS